MQQTLNFNAHQIISKEEMRTWDLSLRELLGSFLRYSRATARVSGIIDVYNEATAALVNDFFKVENGTTPSGGYGTLKIGAGRALMHVENVADEQIPGLATANDSLKKGLVTLFKWDAKDNIPVDGIATYVENDVVYFGFVPTWSQMEPGTCALATSNQVTISGGNFLKLRDQSTKNPTKIRFYQPSGDDPANSDIYEVVSIIDANNIIVSGALTAETDLRMVIVGSYDLKSQGSLSDKCTYPTANAYLYFSKTAANVTNQGGFIVGSLLFIDNSGDFEITDLRFDNLFRISSVSDGTKLKDGLTVDYTYSGEVADFKISKSALVPMAFGDVVGIGGPNTVNFVSSDYEGPTAIGIVVGIGTGVGAGEWPNNVTVLLRGFVRKTTGWFSNSSQKIWLGSSGMTETKPTAAGTMKQVLGVSTSDNSLYFNPSLYYEVN